VQSRAVEHRPAWEVDLRIATLVLFPFTALLLGQEYSASLSVTTADPSGAVVPGTRVVLIDTRRGAVHQADTNGVGMATFDALPPSDYMLEAVKTGFEKLRLKRVTLAVRDRQSLRLELKVAAAETSITVTDSAQGVTTDASQGISVDQNYIQNLPVNGRSTEALIMMTPGITSAAGGAGGGFNANGLRSNTNYYTMDGLSLNSPLGPGPGGGGFRGGGFAGGSLGIISTEMISMDALQEMRVQTSPFAPEFGRSPGAQVSMTSRGGTNQFHGSLFYYFRNDRLNANDWFANSSGYPRPPMRQNRPGGTAGGPLVKNRTFFFASCEVLRLDTPDTLIASVPDKQSRRSAAAVLRPYLNAFPVPNGANLEDQAAEFRTVVVNPSRSEAASLRLDHGWSQRLTLFARYSFSPSGGVSRGSEMVSPNMLSNRSSRSHTVTLGGTKVSSASTLHDLRVNYSQSDSKGNSVMDNFGGAVPLTDAQVFPAGVTSDRGSFSLMILGVGGYSIGNRSQNEQKQFNMVYSVTSTSPAHTSKAGLDYRRTMPTNYRLPYGVSYTFNGLSGGDGAMSSAVATSAQVSSSVEQIFPLYNNFSAYAQDTYRATERTTLTYGLRWDLNPAPGVRSGPKPLVLNGSSVTQDRPLYDTRWLDVAPRVGLAYQMDTTQNREMMFRAGLGLFYDLGYGIAAGAFNGAPYSNDRTITLATLPLSRSDAAPPVMPPEPPYGQVTGADAGLKSPVIIQWNTAIERYFGRGQMLSIGYTGTKGRRLMRTESQPSFGDTYEIARVATNGATSDYHGLQVQFRRRFTSNLQTQVSYTWAHSIDSSSNDMGFGGGFASLFGGGQRGSSDYDIRHNLNFSGSYRVYAPPRGVLGALLGQWFLDWVVTFRTGSPFDVQGLSSDTSSDSDNNSRTPRNFRGGLFAQVRPDYTGEALWIVDANAPGGRRLNPGAFKAPEGYAQGNLGRNVLRGFGTFQADLALRRQFALAERWRLSFSAQAFNAFNNPNFANPSPNEGANLASPNFGIMTRMLNQSFGGGGNSPFRSGGPRSVELALRLQF
jgi:hypothetical protein